MKIIPILFCLMAIITVSACRKEVIYSKVQYFVVNNTNDSVRLACRFFPATSSRGSKSPYLRDTTIKVATVQRGVRQLISAYERANQGREYNYNSDFFTSYLRSSTSDPKVYFGYMYGLRGNTNDSIRPIDRKNNPSLGDQIYWTNTLSDDRETIINTLTLQ